MARKLDALIIGTGQAGPALAARLDRVPDLAPNPDARPASRHIPSTVLAHRLAPR